MAQQSDATAPLLIDSPTFAGFDFNTAIAAAPSEIDQGAVDFDSVVANFRSEEDIDAHWDMLDIPNDALFALPSDTNNVLDTNTGFITEPPAAEVQSVGPPLNVQSSATGPQPVGEAYQPTYMSNMWPPAQGYFTQPLMQGNNMYMPMQLPAGWQYASAPAGPSGLTALPSNDFANLEFAPALAEGNGQDMILGPIIEAVQSPVKLTNPRTSSSVSSRSIELSTVLQRSEYRAEKPKLDPKHPWVRINRSTQGTTKRCGKINKFDASKLYRELTNTFPNWKSSSGYEFTYNDHGELSDPVYSTGAIKQFIYEHPVKDDAKLRLWIQKTPADSARRYPTLLSSKCRFHQCPVHQRLGTGTLVAGHVRVAFDERSFTHGDKADPFYMAGFVHLYCLEKFLDLPEICALPNIEVAADLRQLQSEPNQKYAASLSNCPDGVVAKRFVDACLRTAAKKVPIRHFENYPRAADVAPQDKKHEDTLNFRMNQVKEESRSAAQKRALAGRGLKDTHINVNMGDLERYCQARLSTRKLKYPADEEVEDVVSVSKKRKASEIQELKQEQEQENPAPVRIKKRKVSKRKVRSYTDVSPAPSESPIQGDSPPWETPSPSPSLIFVRGKKRSREEASDNGPYPVTKQRKTSTPSSYRSLSSSSSMSTASSMPSDSVTPPVLRRSPRRPSPINERRQQPNLAPIETNIDYDPVSREVSLNGFKRASSAPPAGAASSDSQSESDNSLFGSASDSDSEDSMFEP